MQDVWPCCAYVTLQWAVGYRQYWLEWKHCGHNWPGMMTSEYHQLHSQQLDNKNNHNGIWTYND